MTKAKEPGEIKVAPSAEGPKEALENVIDVAYNLLESLMAGYKKKSLVAEYKKKDM